MLGRKSWSSGEESQWWSMRWDVLDVSEDEIRIRLMGEA